MYRIRRDGNAREHSHKPAVFGKLCEFTLRNPMAENDFVHITSENSTPVPLFLTSLRKNFGPSLIIHAIFRIHAPECLFKVIQAPDIK